MCSRGRKLPPGERQGDRHFAEEYVVDQGFDQGCSTQSNFQSELFQTIPNVRTKTQ